jgi:hypothetical protein
MNYYARWLPLNTAALLAGSRVRQRLTVPIAATMGAAIAIIVATAIIAAVIIMVSTPVVV